MTDLTPNTTPDGQSCGTCRFAGTHTSANMRRDKVMVRCRRFPPVRLPAKDRYLDGPSLRQQAELTAYPVLTWDDWCGEWAERDAVASQGLKDALHRFLNRDRNAPIGPADYVPDPAPSPRYLIRKRGAYYRPNAEGYTNVRAEAGRFTLTDAISHSHPNGPDGPRDGIDYMLAPEADV